MEALLRRPLRPALPAPRFCHYITAVEALLAHARVRAAPGEP
jgi:hypothetical protein